MTNLWFINGQILLIQQFASADNAALGIRPGDDSLDI
jgi:hypothetical protein